MGVMMMVIMIMLKVRWYIFFCVVFIFVLEMCCWKRESSFCSLILIIDVVMMIRISFVGKKKKGCVSVYRVTVRVVWLWVSGSGWRDKMVINVKIFVFVLVLFLNVIFLLLLLLLDCVVVFFSWIIVKKLGCYNFFVVYFVCLFFVSFFFVGQGDFTWWDRTSILSLYT